MKKKARQTEQGTQKSRAGYAWGVSWCCAECGEKFKRKFDNRTDGVAIAAGRCEWCGKFGSLYKYLYRPVVRHETRTRGAGGGERARAGR